MKRNTLKTLCIIVLLSVMVVGFVGCGDKEKYDVVIVTLTHGATLDEKEYAVEDFSDVGAVKLDHETSYAWELFKRQLAGEDVTIVGYTYESFRRVYTVHLPTNNKAKMLDAIEILEKRTDIESAKQRGVNDTFAVGGN